MKVFKSISRFLYKVLITIIVLINSVSGLALRILDPFDEYNNRHY